MCRSLGYSRDAYYKRCKRRRGHWIRRGVVLKLVKNEREDQPRVGTRKLHHHIQDGLCRAGFSVGRDRLFDILREEELLVKPKRRFSKTTYSRHRYAVAPNKVKELEITRPNQVWVSDITYIAVGKSFAYLFLVTDAFSRRIMGFHLSRDLSHYSALVTVDRAVAALGDAEGIELIHHSDRGCQYCCHEYLDYLEQHGILSSMTDESHCYQNAIAERLNGILKDEFNLDAHFAEFQAARAAVEKAVKLYNGKRLHFSLRLRTPQEVYEQTA
jgi:putative transposase